MVNRPGNWGSQYTCFLVVRARARPLGTFVGLKNPEDRIAVIAYLHSQGSTLPFPAPNPTAAAPAAPADGAAAPAAKAH